MLIYVMANNYGVNSDGIGKYASNFIETLVKEKKDVNFEIFTANTYAFSKIHRIFSLKMSYCVDKLIRKIKKRKPDLVLVEYPFVEENPLFLLKYRKLCKICKKNNIKVSLSLHEYSRVHKMKQYYIRKLVKNANFILMTNDGDRKKLIEYNSDIYIRRIPTSINYEIKDKIQKQNNLFVYFGLINSSKAFDEMIKAWKQFNKNNQYILEILTASNIKLENSKDIKIFKNLCDEDIAKHLMKAKYSILPIKPCVYINNSSFISSAKYGCICIGKFDNSLTNEKFLIDVENYELDNFVFGLKSALLKDNECVNFAQRFGEKYDIKTVCKNNYNIFCREIKYENRD